ncbi:TniQ family protein [Herbaspirillum huttiense]|uniref:TniQ family protein n=1 Tax=Herbaspirillum huttiense TaxID=863372 RepID=UPI0039B10B89
MEISFFPQRAVDETFYSQCAHYHRLSGHASSAATSRILFGDDQASTNHQIPSSLEHFLALEVDAPSPLSLLTEQSIAGIYLAFLTEHQAASFVAARRASPTNSLSKKYGLFGHKDFLEHPLKYCLHCVRDDAKQHGYSYWHNAHQLPGAWLCPVHNVLLTPLRGGQSSKRSWALPPRATDIASTPPVSLKPEIERTLSTLAKAATFLSRQRHLSAPLLSKILTQASKEGTSTLTKHTLFQDMLRDCRQNFLTPLIGLDILEIQALLRSIEKHSLPHATLHPIEWSALIAHFIPIDHWDFAFESETAFSTELPFPPASKLPSPIEDETDRLYRAVLAADRSISATGAELLRSRDQNMVEISSSAPALRLLMSTTYEITRRRFRDIALRSIHSESATPNITDSKIAEALRWLKAHEPDWLAREQQSGFRRTRQGTLF